MRGILRRRPSPALVVACIALLVALSGTSYAAFKLPAKSVGTRELKDNAVTSLKVKNGALMASDFKSGQIPAGPPGPRGLQGPAGAQGAKGDKGDKGDAGVIGALTLREATVSVPGGIEGNGSYETRSVQVNCNADERGITGGTNWSGESDTTELVTVLSTPVYDGTAKKITGWRARGGNDTASSKTFSVVVLCASG